MFISSPDGTQYWDGTAWQPLTTTTHPIPPAPVTTAHPAEPAPGPVPGPYGAAHPGAHAAAPATAHYRLGPAAANTYENNKWAWRIALSPLIIAAAAFVINDLPVLFGILAIAAAILAAVSCGHDVKHLAERGVRVEQRFPLAVLLLYVIAAPAYLIRRTRAAGTTAVLPGAWFGTALVAVIVLAVGPGGPAADPVAIEDQLTVRLTEAGATDAFVMCPRDADYADGDVVICTGSTLEDLFFDIVLQMRNDGYYSWRVQEAGPAN